MRAPNREDDVNSILDCPMNPGTNDAGAATVREYLAALLAELWKEGEAFSGKRPFGNSGWEWDVYAALVAAGLVDGVLDEDGYLDEVDAQQADRLILRAIASLGGTPRSGGLETRPVATGSLETR